MTLRPARPEDASSLAALSLEVWIGTYLRRGINAHFADYVLSEFTPARMEALIHAPDQNIIVSQNQDGIDGYIRVSHRCPDPLAGDHQTEIATRSASLANPSRRASVVTAGPLDGMTAGTSRT